MNLKTTLHAIKHKSILNLTVFSLKKKKTGNKRKKSNCEKQPKSEHLRWRASRWDANADLFIFSNANCEDLITKERGNGKRMTQKEIWRSCQHNERFLLVTFPPCFRRWKPDREAHRVGGPVSRRRGGCGRVHAGSTCPRPRRTSSDTGARLALLGG